ncbi:hypothetical protein CUS34_00095 [Enterococcus faecalis]|nr:hypothetical protein CUS34_00095 [Enterococcus faecalis]RXV23238.1 hypothetical protein CYQ38_04670 [Enterococcus faecalis]RXV24219.1 hypothetical protein CYQ36_04040 [Enterococcus faecalis]
MYYTIYILVVQKEWLIMKTLIRSLCLIIEGLDFHTHVFKFYTERRKKENEPPIRCTHWHS